MEFHLLPIHASFMLLVAVLFIHGYSLTADGSSSSDAGKSADGYNGVYGTPKIIGGSSPYDAIYGIREKTSEGSSYGEIYGNPEKESGNSMNAPKNGYDAVYGTPQKTSENYDAIYGNSQQQTAQYDSIYGSSQQKPGQYDSIYGGPQKTRGSAYGSIYGNPQRADKSSVSMAKNNPKMEQEHQDHGAGLNVFLEKDLHPGTKMLVHFTRTSTATHMLPRQVVESIPFSSNQLPEILKRFSVEENSAEAKIIENTVKECEKPAIEGEDKYCARSVESLIDFSTSRLGKNNINIRVIPNVVEGKSQEYKFEEGVEMVGEESVVCHQLEYPHVVALCHVFPMTKIYRVPLVGTGDGMRVKALAVCHEDTSTWAPDALAFHLLKVEPGTLPICHFLRNGHFVWVPKQLKLYKKPSS